MKPQKHDDSESRADDSQYPKPLATAGLNVLVPSDAEASVLRHMLGIDKPDEREPVPYRDYYCANPSDPQLAAMAGKGFVELYSRHGGYAWYRCTPTGRHAAIVSHRVIRYSKGKRLYSRYLAASDAYPDLTFKEFLTSNHFREARRNA